MTTWVLVAAVFCASVEQGAAPVCRIIQSDRMDIPKYYATRPACVSAVRGELEKTVAWRMNQSATDWSTDGISTRCAQGRRAIAMKVGEPNGNGQFWFARHRFYRRNTTLVPIISQGVHLGHGVQKCGFNYGANNCDARGRKCPKCQGGAHGLDIYETLN